MEARYILGAGMSGLTLAHYLADAKIISPIENQQTSKVAMGPRLIHSTPESWALFRSVFGIEPLEETIKIGFSMKGTVSEAPSEEFRAIYSRKAHDSSKAESSFLSGGVSQFQALKIPGFSVWDTFQILYNMLLFEALDRGVIIPHLVDRISEEEHQVHLRSGLSLDYEQLISTIRRDHLFRLTGRPEDQDLVLGLKSFYECRYGEGRFEYMRACGFRYHYIYVADESYTRRTHYPDGLVLESSMPMPIFETLQTDESGFFKRKIQSVTCTDLEKSLTVVNKVENVPCQIKTSKPMRRLGDIELVGRYSEWDHSIKEEDIVTRALELKESK